MYFFTWVFLRTFPTMYERCYRSFRLFFIASHFIWNSAFDIFITPKLKKEDFVFYFTPPTIIVTKETIDCFFNFFWSENLLIQCPTELYIRTLISVRGCFFFVLFLQQYLLHLLFENVSCFPELTTRTSRRYNTLHTR